VAISPRRGTHAGARSFYAFHRVTRDGGPLSCRAGSGAAPPLPSCCPATFLRGGNVRTTLDLVLTWLAARCPPVFRTPLQRLRSAPAFTAELVRDGGFLETNDPLSTECVVGTLSEKRRVLDLSQWERFFHSARLAPPAAWPLRCRRADYNGASCRWQPAGQPNGRSRHFCCRIDSREAEAGRLFPLPLNHHVLRFAPVRGAFGVAFVTTHPHLHGVWVVTNHGSEAIGK
jgi:hypothetical protein